MCGGEGNHFVSLDMSVEELCQYCRNTCMTLSLYKVGSQYKSFIETRERYFQILQEVKARLREVSLDFLVQLSEETEVSLGIMDPDNVPDTSETIADAAKCEIHRRTFKGLAVASLKKRKIDPAYLGYPRKPKF